MEGYVTLIGGALGLAVVVMFIVSFFVGQRTRNLIKRVVKPTPGAGR